MVAPEDLDADGAVHVSARRLWVGGVATAAVAALAVIVGVFIARGILGISVLAPKAAGNFGNSSTAVYAALAAGFALLATAPLHVLLLGAPRPLAFFVWITALADLAVAAAPFTQPAPLASKVFTAVINVVVGLAVISLLSGVGPSAVRPARDRVQAPAPLNRWLPAAIGSAVRARHARRTAPRSVSTRPPQMPCRPMDQCRISNSRHSARTGQTAHRASVVGFGSCAVGPVAIGNQSSGFSP